MFNILPCREDESTFEKTASWISEAATVVGKVIKTGRASVDEKRPLLEPDEEMGLVTELASVPNASCARALVLQCAPCVPISPLSDPV